MEEITESDIPLSRYSRKYAFHHSNTAGKEIQENFLCLCNISWIKELRKHILIAEDDMSYKKQKKENRKIKNYEKRLFFSCFQSLYFIKGNKE